jgi:hypothetical protein
LDGDALRLLPEITAGASERREKIVRMTSSEGPHPLIARPTVSKRPDADINRRI